MSITDGMNIPNNCHECKFANEHLGICEKDIKYRQIEEQHKPDYCPFIQKNNK